MPCERGVRWDGAQFAGQRGECGDARHARMRRGAERGVHGGAIRCGARGDAARAWA